MTPRTTRPFAKRERTKPYFLVDGSMYRLTLRRGAVVQAARWDERDLRFVEPTGLRVYGVDVVRGVARLSIANDGKYAYRPQPIPIDRCRLERSRRRSKAARTGRPAGEYTAVGVTWTHPLAAPRVLEATR